MNDLYPLTEWRLLVTGARDGATNMAIDEAILGAVAAGRVPPTIRFYTWHPPCLSIGFGQSAGEVDQQRCARRGWELVRRPTGGQAILHVDELTYTVCAPTSEPRVAGGIVESYRRVAAGLLAGLKRLGLESASAVPLRGQGSVQVGPVCFDGPARHEITHGRRKLVGSAQSRRLGGVLQHGALPLEGDISRIVDGFVFEDPAQRAQARAHLGRRALTLESALGRQVTFAQAVESMAAGFAQALNLELVPAQLTSVEWAAAERLRAEKYTSDGWTFKK